MGENMNFDLEDFARLSRATSFQYFIKMDKALGMDTIRYRDECLKLKSQMNDGSPLSQEQYTELGFWYRGLARALLTYIEGLLFVMRKIVVYAEERKEIQLSPGESALVRELDYSLNVSRKRIEERTRPNRFLENFVLSFKLFPQVLGSRFEVDYSIQGWEKMQNLVKMRNNLTHPKSFLDTLLAPELLNIISDAAAWFFTCMHDLTTSVDIKLIDQSILETAKMPEMQRFQAEQATRKE
jgi:hypothetical protein